MNYRQAVIDTLNHRQNELNPWTFEVTSGFAENYQKKYPCEDVEKDLESHILFGRYKKQIWLNSTLYEDAFGVQWQLGEDGGDIGVPMNELVDEDSVDEFVLPEIDRELLNKGLKLMKEDKEHFRTFRFTYSMYERVWALMGMENVLCNMLLNEKETMRLFDRVLEYNLQLLDLVLDEDFEGVLFGDDWGKQKGLIMGPECWRKFIKPCMAKMFEKVKSKGKYVLLHCCGDIEALFPELIEIGLDAYNTVQPEIYDLRKIKREYGKDLTFWGAMSTQQFLAKSTPQQVFEKSVETIKILGAGGGYIFSPTHAITPDIPPENIRAMYDAVKSVRF